jgi:hypothetical protein
VVIDCKTDLIKETPLFSMNYPLKQGPLGKFDIDSNMLGEMGLGPLSSQIAKSFITSAVGETPLALMRVIYALARKH